MTTPHRRWPTILTLAALLSAQTAALADKSCEASWAKVDSCKSPGDVACLAPLPVNPDPIAEKWAPGFDYERQGCLPSAGVSIDGRPNPGIKLGGTTDGHCAWKNQLPYANTFYRGKCVTWTKPGESQARAYCAHMYAQYFVKDQTSNGCITGKACGHTNDWEFGMVWTTDDVLTHASVSQHSDVDTKKIDNIRHQGNRVYMVYHRNGLTHTMNFAEAGYKPVNPSCTWYTPTIVTWEQMSGSGVANNSYLHGVLDTHSWGRAIVPFNEVNFVNNIRKGLPKSYPPAALW